MSYNLKKSILDDDSFFGSESDESSVGQEHQPSKKKIFAKEPNREKTLNDDTKEIMQRKTKSDHEQRSDLSHKVMLGKSIQAWKQKRKRMGPPATFSPHHTKQNISTLAISHDYEMKNKPSTSVPHQAMHVDLTPKSAKDRKMNLHNDAVIEFKSHIQHNEGEQTVLTYNGSLSYPASTPVVTTSSMLSVANNKSSRISSNTNNDSLSNLNNPTPMVDCIAIYDPSLQSYRLEVVDVHISNLHEVNNNNNANDSVHDKE